MKAIDFEQANFTLRAGGNTKTVALKLCLAAHSQIRGPVFYVSKWEMEQYEMEKYIVQIKEIMKDSGLSDQQEDAIIQKIISILPPVYLSVMHTPPPVMLLAESPFVEGAMKPLDAIARAMQTPNSRPEEN